MENKQNTQKPKILNKSLYAVYILTLCILINLVYIFNFDSFFANSAWYNSGWLYRKAVTIDNTGNASELTTYQVKVDVVYDADMQDDFDDLRFTDTDGSTLLDHFRESYTASTSAVFWVEVPTISASSSKVIYIYYGKADAASASNGDNVFNFFDHFDTNSVANYTWFDGTITDHSEHPSIKNGKLYYAGGSAELVVYDLDEGTVVQNCEVPAWDYYVSSPIVDAAGAIHVYAFNAPFLYKVDEIDCSIDDFVGVSVIDFESITYDSVNEALIYATSTGVVSTAIADYGNNWTYALVQNSGAGVAGAVPVIVGDYVYYRSNASGKMVKLNKTTGALITTVPLTF